MKKKIKFHSMRLFLGGMLIILSIVRCILGIQEGLGWFDTALGTIVMALMSCFCIQDFIAINRCLDKIETEDK
jgi:ATP/ADP translocase